MAILSLAVIADIHHGRDTFTKRGTVALELLDRFLTEAAGADAAAIIDLGDRISDVDAETDRRLMAEVAAVFDRTNLQRFHVDGNHDRAFLSAEENDRLVRPNVPSTSVEFDEARLVLWRPDVSLSRMRGFSLAPGDLGRLADLLNGSAKRTILVSHVPLSGQSMAGNYWFEENPAHAAYAEQGAIRAVIAAAPCPVIALAGHVHWNSVTTVDHTAHLTLQSLTDCWRTLPHPAGSSALLRIDGETLSWRVSSRDPFAVELPFPKAKPRRIERLPRFADIVEDPVERYRVMAGQDFVATA